MNKQKIKVIISGGGTAGHINPAIAVAQVLEKMLGSDGVEILFVGAEGKMEMERVPKAGYRIEGLPVAGLQRSLFSPRNLSLPGKLWKSLRRASRILEDFRPDVVAGFGGYASAPVLWAAQRRKIPTIIQEQNSYAGLTNKMLGKKARAVCVAYDDMGRFFAPERIISTGNPLRNMIGGNEDPVLKAEAYNYFGLDPLKKTLLVVGGSLGTRTLNRAMLENLDTIEGRKDIQVIWQNGGYYENEMASILAGRTLQHIYRAPFLERMDLAYAIADVVISRAGACTVSELQLIGKPVIFVPSPNVSEDHQTKNAQALVGKQAAMLIPDSEAVEKVIPAALQLLDDDDRRRILSENIRRMGTPDAARLVAEQIIQAAGFPMPAKGTLDRPFAGCGCGLKEKRITRSMNPQRTYDNVYLIGIGGIGMSALARYFKYEGYAVAGYDRTPSELTDRLVAEGIPVHFTDDISEIPVVFKVSPARTLVIYTPAVPADHAELNWFRDNGYNVLKRSRVLGLLGEGKRVMAVAGTHGKTSTTTMVAWFNTAGAGQGSAFLGGISKNFDSNLVLGTGDRLAVEADEFDRSFLQLTPAEAVITSVDADHLDIYGDHDQLKTAFKEFTDRIIPGGTLILKNGIDLPLDRSDITVYRYSLSDPETEFHAENLSVDGNGYYSFDLVFPDRRVEKCTLGIPGAINVENCVAAAALVWLEGFDDEKLRNAIASFRGVQRRFDFRVNRPGAPVYMDDYAHHPRELEAMLGSVRKMFPGREITIVFQPHLYTRTRDFADGFSRALEMADRILLLPIYPARELPIPGVTSELILDGIDGNKTMVSKENLLTVLETLPLDVLVSAGAGDIDRFVQPITELLNLRYPDAQS